VANDPTIQPFSAGDIEKYHKGELSAREMHALEKAALDDPFLADALEGYAVPGVHMETDMADLEKRLAAKMDERKVIPITPAGKSSFPWLRAAALIVLAAGAGFLVYQFAFNQKQSNIAKTQTRQDQEPAASNNNALVPIPQNDKKDTAKTIIGRQKPGTATHAPVVAETIEANAYSLGLTSKDSITVTSGLTTNAIAPVIKVPEEKERKYREDDRVVTTNKTAPLKTEQLNKAYYADSLQGAMAYDTYRYSPQNAKRQNSNRIAHQLNRANIFRGRITDANSNALPFANITNTADNVGTYTDVNGNFILTSPDSVLNVQVRSVGFENTNVQLQNTVADNQVVLEEDHKSLAEVVISNKQLNSNRSRNNNNTMVLEEPEPVDGWVNYDTYLANNLVVPETFRSKQASGGEVQLSFEVNKDGEPVNITVVKSLCDSCDKEAIRLVKEGPKWKRKTKKGRTSVTISF
jgi:hypothetical protein